MADPTPQQLSVAVQALREDAAIWSTAADRLTAARHAGMPLGLQGFHFSFIGDMVGLPQAYAALQDKILRLLGEGSDELQALSQALITAANDYEQADNEAYRNLHHLY